MEETGTKCDENIRKFYFFLGRATPPHSGHISVIMETIHLARAGRTCALILLGDGPHGGLRTSSNPIEHDTKAEFIRHKLRMLRCEEPRDYVILKKDSPNHQVVDFVRGRIPDHVTQISISQVAGDKDDDATKLGWIRDKSIKQLKTEFPLITVEDGGVVSVRPVPEGTAEQEKAMSATEKAMSATFVRETAVACYDSAGNNMDTAFTEWLKALPFYSEDEPSRILSRTMFEQIIKYKDIKSGEAVIKEADGFLKRSGDDIDVAIGLFLGRFECYVEHEPTRLLLINRFKDNIARRTNPDEQKKAYVTSSRAKPDPTPRSGSGSAAPSKKHKPSGGSRRKHTRRRFRNLRNKKTLRTNRRHNKHRHTRKRF